MKILHVAKAFEPQAGGVARHIAGLAAACRALGVDSAIPASGEISDLRAAVRAADLVHLHGARTAIVAKAALIAALAGRPAIYTPHCYYDHGSWAKRLGKRAWDLAIERPLVARAAATILLDECWLGDMAARGLAPRHAAVVPNCIAAPRPAPAHEHLRGDPALLSIGRLDPVKRLDDAIAALSLPGLEGAALHLVGDGPDRERLERLARAAGLDGRLVFHGRLGDEAARAMRAGADLFLLPSEREGLPTVMLESLAEGLPVLASDIPGNRAIAEALGWTALFPVGDRTALRDGIGRWAGAPVPESVGARLAARFTWEARAPEIVALYRQAVGR